jgi:hypothetical protein
VVVTMLQAQKRPCNEIQAEHSIEVHAYTGSVDIQYALESEVTLQRRLVRARDNRKGGGRGLELGPGARSRNKTSRCEKLSLSNPRDCDCDCDTPTPGTCACETIFINRLDRSPPLFWLYLGRLDGIATTAGQRRHCLRALHAPRSSL